MIVPRSERNGDIRRRHAHRRGRRIGGRKTIVQEFPNLPSALPSRLIVKGARYSEVPDMLRNNRLIFDNSGERAERIWMDVPLCLI
jgi:hypothetical protein